MFSFFKYGESFKNKNYTYQLSRIKSPISHPLFFGLDTYEENVEENSIEFVYDPYISSRLKAKSISKRGFEVDEYGFVHNGKPYNYFDKNIKKIILLGGSTVQGIKLKNECTISAFLEDFLNQNSLEKNFEVINAGIGGSYSPMQFVRFGLELIHLDPKMVIALDGFNDYWHSFSASKDSADWNGIAIPNRTNYQMAFLGADKNINVEYFILKYPLISKIFWNSSMATIKIFNLINRNQNSDFAFTENPWPKLSLDIMKNIYNQNSHAIFFIKNWKNLNGIANANNIKSYFFLQPVIPISNKKFTKQEISKYESHFTSRQNIDKKEYEESIRIFYQEAIDLIDLDIANEDSSVFNNSFADLSQVFFEIKEDVFIDNVHYTAFGNYILAREILKYIASDLDINLINKTNLFSETCLKTN